MLAALYALAELMAVKQPLSKLLKPYNRYFSSGEINSEVKDLPAAIATVKGAYEKECEIDDLDGLTFTADTWWFNLRPSNTEPLLRLNVEADSEAQMKKIRDAVLSLIKGH
jgi:phosphomannomutase